MSKHNHTSQIVLDNEAIVSVASSSTVYETKYTLAIKGGASSTLVSIQEEELRKVQASIDLILANGHLIGYYVEKQKG